MSTAKTRGSDRAMTVALLSSIATGGLATAANASVTNNWIEWNAPATYGQTGFYNANGQTSYQYATTATGTLTMPDSTVVYVRLTGEVVSPTAYGGLPTGGGFCGPSGFASNGTTISNFWSQMPVSGTTPGAPDDGSAFLSANVTSLPTNGDHIGLIGATNGGVQTQTIEFFSDAGFTTATTVQNILILAGTVGGAGTQMSWTFDRDFDILSDNAGAPGGSGLTKSSPSAGNYVLSGEEGSGTIQFTGSFTSFSWMVSAPEVWSSWGLGATSAAAPSAVPGAGLASLVTLGVAGLARRRRR